MSYFPILLRFWRLTVFEPHQPPGLSPFLLEDRQQEIKFPAGGNRLQFLGPHDVFLYPVWALALNHPDSHGVVEQGVVSKSFHVKMGLLYSVDQCDE
jgi:hypothetical protein